MWIFSVDQTKCLLLLLLGLARTCTAQRKGFDADEFKTMLGDLSSLESEEQESILKSFSSSKDTVLAEESKKSILIRVQPSESSDLTSSQSTQNTRRRKITPTSKEYDIIQWYDTPTRNSEHHVKGRKLDSTIDEQGKAANEHDMKAQGTTYSTTNYYHDSHEEHYDERFPHSGEHHHDDHYHVDHDSPPVSSSQDDDQRHYKSYASHEEPKNHDTPSSDVFYKKLKLKKVKKHCLKKHKKVPKPPPSPDPIVRSRTNNVPEVSSHYEKPHSYSVPALSDTDYNNMPKYPHIPDPSPKQSSFSDENLHHDVPRSHIFYTKDGEKVNHYHLHNHHYHVDANGRRVKKVHVPDYRNLADHFERLKSTLTSPEADDPYHRPYTSENFGSTLSIGHPNPSPSSGSQKLGYHYTGPHESYGRKTYKRINPNPKEKVSAFYNSPDPDEKVSSFYNSPNPDEKVSSFYNSPNPNEKVPSFYSSPDTDEKVSSFYSNQNTDEKFPFYNSPNSEEKVSSFYNSPNPDEQVSSYYNRPNTDKKVSSFYSNDKSIGSGMFRYGAGQYGTDEFSSTDNKGPYPNEVTIGTGKPYSGSGEIYEPVRSKTKSTDFQYNSDSPMTPYKPFSVEQDSSYNARDKPKPYHNVEDKAPYAPPKPTQAPLMPTVGPTSAEYNSGSPYGSPYGPPYGPPYEPPSGPPSPYGQRDPTPYGSEEGKNEPPLETPIRENPPPPLVTHSVSYSGDDNIFNGPIPFAPVAPSLYIRPGPDPLTIPKNAKVFEHHIRLHPMHYNIMAMGRAMNYQPMSFSNNVYPVPLHKLISDPMKMPLVPMPPMRAPPIRPMVPPYRGHPMPPRFW